jgi:hypothetical protein
LILICFQSSFSKRKLLVPLGSGTTSCSWTRGVVRRSFSHLGVDIAACNQRCPLNARANQLHIFFLNYVQVLDIRRSLVSLIDMAQEQAKEEPKGLFTTLFDGVKNAGSAVVDGVGKVVRSGTKTLLGTIVTRACAGWEHGRGRREDCWRCCSGYCQGLS